MIEQLIDLFDAAVTAPVVTKHGLAILGTDGPLRRTQTGQYTPIAVDNDAPWSYWRIGDIKSSPYDIYACSMGALQQVPLRLVMLLPNDCGQRDILLAAGRAVTATTGAAKELLGAARVRVVGQRIAVDGVGQAEKISDIPLQWSLIAIDMDLEVIGTADCLVGCGDGPSVLCSVITTATNAEVAECLGDRVNDICDSTPCEVTVNGTPSDTPTITVTQDGVPAGTLNPATGNVDVPPCPPCIPGEAYPVDTDGTPVGHAVPVPSGASVPVTAPNGLVMTSDGAKVVMEVKSGEGKILPKSKIHYIDATGSEVFTIYDNKFDGYLSPAITIPRRELLNMSGNPVSSPATYVALDHLIDGTLPKAPDSTITVNSTPFVNAPSGGAFNVPVKDTDGVPRGSKVGSEWIVPAPGVGPVLEFAFADRDQYTMVWTIKSFTAGTYTSFTPTGTYGTITYSKNGGAFSSVTGSIVLGVGDTIQLKRTNTTGVAGTTWEP